MIILVIFAIIFLVGDGFLCWLYSQYFKEYLQGIYNHKTFDAFKETLMFCGISWVMAMFTFWCFCGLAMDNMSYDIVCFWGSGKGFLRGCEICLIPSAILLCIFLTCVIFIKYQQTNTNKIVSVGFRLLLVDVTLFLCIVAFMNDISATSLKVFGIITACSLGGYVIVYPWVVELREKNIKRKTIKRIETDKKIIKLTSDEINAYTANYNFVDKATKLFLAVDNNSQNQMLLANAIECAKRRDYNQLCINIKKCWKKGKIKKIFNDKFIEKKAVVWVLNILKECDNSNSMDNLFKKYEKLKKNTEYSGVPKMPKRLGSKKPFDISSLVNFYAAIKSEAENKDRDLEMLKNAKWFESVAERYLHLKRKGFIFNTILLFSFVAGLTYNLLVWIGMF